MLPRNLLLHGGSWIEVASSVIDRVQGDGKGGASGFANMSRFNGREKRGRTGAGDPTANIMQDA